MRGGEAGKAAVRRQFGRAAAAYVSSEIHAQGESLDVLLRELRPRRGWTAIDIATGAGHTALALAPRVKSVTAIDITPEMLREAKGLARKRGLRNVTFTTADATTLPIPTGTLDLVTCRLAHHHFPDPRRAMREMARVLKPGGRVGFTDNIVVGERKSMDLYNEFERRRDPSHVEVRPLSRLLAWFDQAGLDVTFVRHLTKEFEFEGWCDRQSTPERERIRLREILRTLPRRLAGLLVPRTDNGDLYFTLWEVVIIAHKPC